MGDPMSKRAERGPRSAGRGSTLQWFLSTAVAAAIVGLLIALAMNEHAMGGLQLAYAAAANSVLHLLGHSTQIAGNVVGTGDFGITVVTACTGLFTTALYLVAVALFPTTWMRKLAGVGLGIGGIAILNVVRLVSLYYVGVHWPSALDVVHQLVWQSLLIAFAVALWLLWAGRAAGRRRVAR